MQRRFRVVGLGLALAVLVPVGMAMAIEPGSTAFLDAEFGFRGARFGAPVEAFGGLVPAETQGPGRVCYERSDEDLRLGDGVTRSIRYCFADGRLGAVLIAVEGERNTDALLQWMVAAYGRGQRERGVGGARRIVWEGQRANAYYGEPRGPEAAQAQIWAARGGVAHSEVAPRGPRPEIRPEFRPEPPRGERRQHRGHPDFESAPSAGEFQIGAPRRVRRGLVAQISVRYRGLATPGVVRLLLPPELVVESSIPTAQVFDGELVWDGLQSAAGNLKFKALVRPETQPGAVLEVRGEMLDAAGGRSLGTALMRAQ